MAILATAPTRIDLAGGTLDIWPLYLLHAPAVTLNTAIELRAEARIAARAAGVRIESLDRGVSEEAADAGGISRPELELGARVLASLAPGLCCELSLRSAVPAGSGLGGSSALAIAAGAAAAALAGRQLEGEALIDVVQDVETSILAVPTGRQDYAAAVWGGTAALWWRPGGVAREPLDVPELERQLVLAYTGEPHFSGANNWQVTRARLDGDKSIARGLEAIAEAARACARALAAGDPAAAGAAIAGEWEARRRLTPAITTPALDRLIALACAEGAWGAKVCGAGGGGCLFALAPAERRAAVAAAWSAAGARVMEVGLAREGLRLERGAD